ncbi:MAG: hypothetical protein AAF235_01730 [Planctomycetota bacterium]
MTGETPQRLAHYSQGGLGTGGGAPPVFAAMAPLLAPMLLLVVPIMVLTGLDRFPWLPMPARIAVVVVLVVGAIWWAAPRVKKSYRRGTDITGLPMAMDQDARVNVICWNDQRKVHEAGLADVDFEPEQFRAWIPDRPPAWLTRLGRERPKLVHHVRGVGISGVWCAVYLPLVFGVPWIALFFIAIAGGVAVWAFRRPTYIRVVPGRCDVVRYPSLGSVRSASDVESIDLRSEPVRFDLKNRTLRVGPWSRETLPKVVGTNPDRIDPAKASVRLWLVHEPEAATRALLRACVSTADAPSAEDLDRALSGAASAGS